MVCLICWSAVIRSAGWEAENSATVRPAAFIVDRCHVVWTRIWPFALRDIGCVRRARSASVLGDLPQKIQPRGGGWEILVAGADLDIVALGDDLSFRVARQVWVLLDQRVRSRSSITFACVYAQMTVRPASHDLASCTLSLSLEGLTPLGTGPQHDLGGSIDDYGKLFTHWRPLATYVMTPSRRLAPAPAAAPYSRQRNRLRMGFSGDFDVIPHPPATAGAAVEKGRIPDRLIDPAGGAVRLRFFVFFPNHCYPGRSATARRLVI